MAVFKVKFTKTKRHKLAQILWILNWISVATGVILFSLGLFLKIEIKKRSEVMAKGEINSVPNMLISVGVIACIINFLGGKICYDCSDTTKFSRWRLVMLPYIVCTFCFTFCILVGALTCYTMRNELEESLYLGLRDAIKFYKDTDIPGRCFLKKTIDLLQIGFQCCGNNGFRDWFEIQWISVRYLNMASKERKRKIITQGRELGGRRKKEMGGSAESMEDPGSTSVNLLLEHCNLLTPPLYNSLGREMKNYLSK
uniref:Peripherin 2 n=1 Tax=Gopherus agassizii TaxID=38772 RepID=A0A452I7G6_9SAUR